MQKEGQGMKISKSIICAVTFGIGMFITMINIKYLFASFGNLLWVSLAGAACVWLYYAKADRKILYAGIVALAFVLRLLFVIFIKTEPVSDFDAIFQAAKGLAAGDKSSFAQGQYLHVFGYYIPFTLYESLFVKLAGGGWSISCVKIHECAVYNRHGSACPASC